MVQSFCTKRQNECTKVYRFRIGIGEIKAGCLPEDKLNFIDSCQENAQSVYMVGDGINDAPALKMANVGIAMGGVGSDIAVDTADIALVDDEVKELPHLFMLSKRMMTTIKLNLTFSMGLNFLATALAITGIFNPVVGALVHNAGSVAVIINSALLLNGRKDKAKARFYCETCLAFSIQPAIFIKQIYNSGWKCYNKTMGCCQGAIIMLGRN